MKLKSLKNKKIIISILLLIIGVISINYTFFKPTKINFYIASKLYKTPANTAFTDDNFYKCVVDEYNKENGERKAYTESLTDEQLQTITYLRCHGKEIVSADGLEKLKSLKTLELGSNQLINLNISDNRLLEKLRANDNQLTSLDLSNNSKLQYLSIINNQITTLDTSKNPSLKNLYAYKNKLTNLDVSKNLALEDLYVYNNQLTSLDVRNNKELKNLIIYDNQLTNLDVSNNVALEKLSAYNNMLTSLTFGQNSVLTNLDAYSNNLTFVDLSMCRSLLSLKINNNQLTNLDISKNYVIERLEVGYNQLTNLDISNNPALEYLSLRNNKLTNLDVSNKTALKNLYASNNQIINLDISNSPALIDLDVSNNQITILNASDNSALEDLDVRNNRLTNLNISNITVLETLYASENQMVNIDIRNNIALIVLDLSANQLTNIDITKNVNLKYLNLSANQLTNIDVSNNTALKELRVHDNQLTWIDVSNNLSLERLYVKIVQLETIDLSQNNKLSDISVSHMIYRYIGDNIQLSNYVKLPSHIQITNNWKSVSPHIASVDNNGMVTTLDTGIVNIINRNSSYTIDSVLNIIEITSKKYIIENDKDYIYIGTDAINENIIDNFTVPQNIDLNITTDNKLQVKYNEDILKEFTLINVSSDVYDLTNDYIYVGTETIDLTKINITNATIIEEDNQLKVKYNDEIIDSLNISKIYSSSYVFFKDNIFIGNNKLDFEKINLINLEKGTVLNENEKLKVKYNNETIYEYNILSIDFKELIIKGKSIIITEDTSYEDFISNITPNGVTYKIYDKEVEITEGTITKDMVLKIYKDDEEIYEYQITDEFLDLSLLNVDEENLLIKDLKLGTTISSFKDNISTNGSVKILDQDGDELKDTDLVRSGAKVIIELSKDRYEYTLSVKGDVTGTGTSTVSDVGKLYQYLRKKISMDLCYVEAGNVMDTDNEIKITDVGKLYQFIKGKIESLED